jgi:hypothetical protein
VPANEIAANLAVAFTIVKPDSRSAKLFDAINEHESFDLILKSAEDARDDSQARRTTSNSEKCLVV